VTPTSTQALDKSAFTKKNVVCDLDLQGKRHQLDLHTGWYLSAVGGREWRRRRRRGGIGRAVPPPQKIFDY